MRNAMVHCSLFAPRRAESWGRSNLSESRIRLVMMMTAAVLTTFVLLPSPSIFIHTDYSNARRVAIRIVAWTELRATYFAATCTCCPTNVRTAQRTPATTILCCSMSVQCTRRKRRVSSIASLVHRSVGSRSGVISSRRPRLVRLRLMEEQLLPFRSRQGWATSPSPQANRSR